MGQGAADLEGSRAAENLVGGRCRGCRWRYCITALVGASWRGHQAMFQGLSSDTKATGGADSCSHALMTQNHDVNVDNVLSKINEDNWDE